MIQLVRFDCGCIGIGPDRELDESDARPHRRTFSPVRVASDDRTVYGCGDRRPFGDFRRPVGAPVVGDDDFARDPVRAEERRRGLKVECDFFPLVKCGDDDAESDHALAFRWSFSGSSRVRATEYTEQRPLLQHALYPGSPCICGRQSLMLQDHMSTYRKTATP